MPWSARGGSRVPVGAVLGIAIAPGGRPDGRPGVPGAAGRAWRPIGRLLFTDYLFPFEVTSLLLLAALVGALTLAKRRASP